MRKLLSLLLIFTLISVFPVFSYYEEPEYADTYKDKTLWSVVASSEHENWPAKRMIDGYPGTYWHTDYGWENSRVSWKAELPHTLEVDFGEELPIAGFIMTMRQDKTPAGQPTKMNFYIKVDGEYQLVSEYNYKINTLIRREEFGSVVMAKEVKIEYLDTLEGHGTMCDFDIIKPKEGEEPRPFDTFLKEVKENALYPIPKGNAFATYDGDIWQGHVVTNIIDDSPQSYWQAETYEKAPYVLDVDLGSAYELLGFTYTPRQADRYDGYWEKFNVYTSLDGKNYELSLENYSFPSRSLSPATYLFDEKTKVQFFRFEILSGTGNLGSCAELDFLQDYQAYQKRIDEESRFYTLKIGSDTIVHKDGELKLDTAPFIADGTTFIPIRGLLELMDAKIEWDGEVQGITIKKDMTEIYMQIQNRNVFVTKVRSGKERYSLIAAPRIKDSRTFIPVRFISEHLGYNVSWNGETQEITITK
ncbi:MAG: discoidin domain-containing protein [Clostridia bacterium]|nr:discoidin domain-containing protein [Clostridia bacterium]